MGKIGYRKPAAKRVSYTFRPTEDLLTRLERHRFTAEETDPLINRLLRQLQRAIAAAPSTIAASDTSPRQKPLSFKVDEQLQEFILDNWQGDRHDPKRGEKRLTVEFLLNWATQLEPVLEYASRDDVLTTLQQFSGQRLAADKVLLMLVDRCSEQRAIAWINELAELGKLRKIDVESGKGVSRLRWGDRLGYIDVL